MRPATDGTEGLAAIAATEDRYEIPIYNRRGIALVRGRGVWLWDADGRRYLDMMSNYGVNVLGHAHPAVTAAIAEQAGILLSCHQSFYSDARARFLQKLESLLPDGLRRVSFANSGAEAVEAALKYARLATGRHRVISTKRGYHGRTLGALSVTGETKHRSAFEPLLPGCEQVPYGDAEALAGCIKGAAAFIVEPVQGESGVRPAAEDYLREVRGLCDESGAVLIFDEVQTAFRTGRTWGLEHSGVVPDVMTLAKPLANGLPVGATVVTDAVSNAIKPGSHGSTFAGNPLVMAAGIATLEALAAPGFNDHVATVGKVFVDRLEAIDSPLIREVRGLGLMVAVELKRNATPILQAMQNEGVLAIPAGSTVVRFLPPLIIGEEEVMKAVEVLHRALETAEIASN